MWRRALGSFTAQAGASAALIALPEGIRDDVPLGVALGATYVSGAGAFYALGGAGPSIAARSDGTASAGSPLSAEGAGKFAAALEASAPAGFAGGGSCRRRPSPTSGTSASRPRATSGLVTAASLAKADAAGCGPWATTIAALQARPAVLEAVVAAAQSPRCLRAGPHAGGRLLSLLELQKASEGDGATATDVVWALLAAAPWTRRPRRAPGGGDAAVPTFVAAKTYGGRRPGYCFRTGDAGGLGYYLDFPYQPLPKGFAPLPALALPDATAAAGDAVSAAQLAWWVREARAATPRAFEGDDITARPGWFGERDKILAAVPVAVEEGEIKK
ncbi:hypothetical protein JL722_13598 [Aureococcus anophagefferens]|nr:hypothetical protein JL722_13598 [Aureococcus anophagefferens]